MDRKAARQPAKGAASPRTVLVAQDTPEDRSAGDRHAPTLDRLFQASDHVDYATANPILAGAAPVLMLLGHLPVPRGSPA